MEDKEELTTMVTVLNQLRTQGYTLDFVISDDSGLCTSNGEYCFSPDQVHIINFYRFEGETNPGDEAILYVIETNSGLKGTVTDAYGPYANEKLEAFMKQVEDLGKNIDK